MKMYKDPTRKQRGAVLIMSLVLMMIVAMLGITGVRTVVMEKNMASNSQYSMQVFQAAETAVEGSIADDTVLADALAAGLSVPQSRTYDVNSAYQTYDVTSGSAVIYTGTAGGALIEGYSLDDFSAYQFQITATGAIATSGATSIHVQDLSLIGPKS